MKTTPIKPSINSGLSDELKRCIYVLGLGEVNDKSSASNDAFIQELESAIKVNKDIRATTLNKVSNY